MTNLPKFMVACDPIQDEDTEYIIHTQPPRLVTVVIDGDEEITFQVVQYTDDLVQMYGDKADAELEKIMQEMADWYASYQEWLEEEADEDDDEE